MKVVRDFGFKVEMDDSERADLREVATSLGVTEERALQIAVENFFKNGCINTPQKVR